MIRLGKIRDRDEYFLLNPEHLRRHACIFGMTGSGKSTTLAILAYELMRVGIPSLIIDRTGEFKNKLKGAQVYLPEKNLSLSPFQLWEGDPIEERVQKQVWLLEEFCRITWSEGLSPLQTRLLLQALYRLSIEGDLSFGSLIEECRKIAREELKVWLEAAEAIASRFGIFSVGKFKRAFMEGKEIEIFDKGIHIVDLSSLEHEAPKNLFSLILISMLMLKMKRLGFSDRIRLALIIDEAHNIANKSMRYSLIEKIAMELRKYGLSLVVSSPNPSEMNSNIISNAGVLIVHQLFSGYEVDVIKKYISTSSFNAVLEEILGKLRIGEAFIRTPENTEGCIVKIGIKEHEHMIN